MSPASGTVDLAIVGGGIVGLATARAAAEGHGQRVVVLEAEDRLASHQTGRNSGVIHSGLYYAPGSLKATLCTEGRDALYRYCDERRIAYERCGKLVVATRETELPALEELARRGRENGLDGIERLTADQISRYEPAVRGVAALWVPQTGIVDYQAVAAALAGDVVACGGRVETGARVTRIGSTGDGLELTTAVGVVRCRALVNCGGLQCDRVARLAGVRPSVRIIPFRGEYYELVGESASRVRGLVYPVPDPALPFLGVHFTRTVDGRMIAGPNAVLAGSRHGYDWTTISARDLAGTFTFPGFWRLARRFWRVGVDETLRSLSRARYTAALREMVPQVDAGDLEPYPAGVRAQAVDRSGAMVDDFRIDASERALHVLNAPSPAATASLAIGRHLAARAAREFGWSSRGPASAAEPVLSPR